MKRVSSLLSLIGCSLTLSAINLLANPTSAYGISLTNTLPIAGGATDLAPLVNGSGGANINRLGGFFSDLYYDRHQNVYYGLSDRGPGGGTLAYNTRVQKFSLELDSNTGAISNFKLLDTILFSKNGQNFNGLNPSLLNGNSSQLGLSFDPEGFVIGTNGNFYVSDEYGPSVYEFRPDGSFVRAFQTPANLIPLAGTTPNYVDGRGILTSGRQDNRGFEGIAISPDGNKLLAMLQDPLINEGEGNDGRKSRNLRIVEFDTATGQSTAQYIYQLENLTDINDRLPGTSNDFSSTAQGRNIGISAIAAINDHEFLVLERDNRGLGVDDPTASNPIGSKRVYKIDLTGATDISTLSLAGTSTLPAGVTAVSKSLFLDIAAALEANGQVIPEKIEGLAIGSKLANGGYALLLGTDNDYSVTQNSSGTQFDVCTNGTTSTQVPIDSGCPSGQNLIPTYLYSFQTTSQELKNYVAPATTPEPTALGGLVLVGLVSLWQGKRRRRD
jgi:hypothetical protein